MTGIVPYLSVIFSGSERVPDCLELILFVAREIFCRSRDGWKKLIKSRQENEESLCGEEWWPGCCLGPKYL